VRVLHVCVMMFPSAGGGTQLPAGVDGPFFNEWLLSALLRLAVRCR
jgi:hypothetical protein